MLVRGQTLGGGNGERIAVVEADVAVPVPDLVVAERHPAPVIGAGRVISTGASSTGLSRASPDVRPNPFLALRVRSGRARQHLQVLHRDHGAVEELLLPAGGADAEPVAGGNLQRR